ncbi:MAG: discoidin domain-containing protein [Bacteroidia bacterium]
MAKSILLRLRQYRRMLILSLCVLFILVTSAVGPMQVLNYGIDTPQAVGAYFNNTFPTVAPASSATWTSIEAFPNLIFTDPIQLLEVPYADKFFMAGKKGRLWSFSKSDTATSTKATLLDIESKVLTSGDAGLMGAAFHPEYGVPGSPNREYLYIWYRAKGPTSSGNLAYLRLVRYNWVPGSSIIDPNTEFIMIQQYDRHQWHNGGGMFFGLDGFLYISVGDEGGANDQYNTGQKINVGLLAGALRIDVDMDPSRSHPIRRQPLNPATPPTGWPDSYSQGYYVPNDNPWLATDGSILEEFYAIGFRSPHRMTQDPVTGDIWMGDVGQGTREEVSLVPKGSNLQWPYREGAITTGASKPKPNPLIGFDQAPVHDYPRSEGQCVIGGIVYRGNKWNSSLGGKYIFGDHQTRKVWTLDYDPATGNKQVSLLTTIPSFGSGGKQGISNFSSDSTGEVYVLKLFGTNLNGGKIYKLRPTSYTPDPPQFLSQTGVFPNLPSLNPAAGLIPYATNSPLWSDGSAKKRWVAIPNNGSYDSSAEQVVFAEDDEWTFPTGTVFIKHFEMPLDANNPNTIKRLETRFMIRAQNGGLYGVTYKWNDAGTDAELLYDSDTVHYTITKADLSQENRIWEFPSRANCMTCHNDNAGGTLGLNTHQMNGDALYPTSGNIDNQLRTWNHLGIFSNPIVETDIPNMLRAAPVQDASSSLELRVRSYLDANCSHCHRPNGVNTGFDARFATELDNQNIVHGNLFGSYGISGAELVKPRDPSRSILLKRDMSTGADQMPPLARSVVDEAYITVLEDWIGTLDPACEPVPLPKANYSVHYVDSEEANHLAANAFDGLIETLWHTEFIASDPVPPHEIQIDLGDTMEVSGFRYWPRQDLTFNGTIANYNFYVSLDGVNWESAVASGTFVKDKTEKEVIHGPKYGRYVRLQALSEVNNNPWISVAEMEILVIDGSCFAPAGLSETPAMWLSADEYGGSLDDGSLVANWADLSGKNNAPAAISGKEPTYYSQSLNGHGVVSFDGTDDWLKVNGLANVLSGQSAILSVVIPRQDASHGYYLSTHLGGTNKIKFGHGTNGELIYDDNDPTFVAGNYVDKPSLVAFDINPNTQIDGWLNGQTGNSLTTVASSGADRVSLGQEFDGSGNDNETSDHWKGDLAEMIVLQGNITALDRMRAESYLALKYGLHLNHNYYASDWNGSEGTTLWNVGGGFDNHITGMGRDDRSGLDQRQSTGVEGLVSIYHGNYYNGQFPTINASNPNTFDIDRSFVLWGDNGAAVNALDQTIYGGANSRVARVWQVSKRGQSGLLTVRIPKAALPGTTTALYINRNGDAAFPNSPQTLIYNLLDDGTHWYSLAELQNGDVFSFGDGTGITFPVEWLDLAAVQQGEDIGLSWGTTQEINSDYFAVERSLDGEAFDEIGQTRSTGTTSQEQLYRFIDFKAVYQAAEQLYYRIRQVDLDGSFSYSNTVSINPDRLSDALNLYLAPNPADQQVELLIQAGASESLQISVLNSLGQEVYGNFMAQAAKTERLALNLQDWASGIYYVRVDNGTAAVVKKLIVR